MMVERRSRRCLVAIAAVAALAGGPPRLSAHDPTPTKVTWTRDIHRIFAARCVSCHRAGGPAPIALDTYDEARLWAAAIREQVLSRKMPIWRAARGYGDFANDPSLSPFDIALVTAWVDGGTPKGEPAPALAGTPKPPAGPEPPARPPGPTREMTLACGETPIAGRLLAVSPRLDDGGSASILAVRTASAPEIVAWIRGYDSKHPQTYWLRRPIQLPRGSRLTTSASGTCHVVVTLAAAKPPAASTSATLR